MLLLPIKRGKSGKIEEQLLDPRKFMGCKHYTEGENNQPIGVIFYVDPITFKGSVVVPKFSVQDIINLMKKAELPIADYREDEILFKRTHWDV